MAVAIREIQTTDEFPVTVHQLDDAAFTDLLDARLGAFTDALPSHLRQSFDELRELEMEAGSRETDRIMAELCRHLPMMAPTIRLLSTHLAEQFLADVGHCCELSA